MTRSKKRKRDTENEVDSILYTTQIDIQNKQMNITSGVKIPSILIGDNFTSPEAHALFKPSENETVIIYLSCRVQVLGDGMIDDHILKMMYTNEEDAIIATFASTHLRTKYMSLKYAYENSIQYMNDKTWLECCRLVVDVLAQKSVKECPVLEP